MNDTYEFVDDEPQEERVVTLRRSQIKHLEDKAKRADTAEAEAAALRRKVAMAEAGIPLSDARTKYLGVVGDDPEALKQAAIELGILQAPPPPAPQVTAEEEHQLAVINATSSGATVAPVGDDVNAQMRAASTPDEVIAWALKGGVSLAHEQ